MKLETAIEILKASPRNKEVGSRTLRWGAAPICEIGETIAAADFAALERLHLIGCKRIEILANGDEKQIFVRW